MSILARLPRENKHMTSLAGKQTNKHMRRAHVSLIQLLFRMWNASMTDAATIGFSNLFLISRGHVCLAPVTRSLSIRIESTRINYA